MNEHAKQIARQAALANIEEAKKAGDTKAAEAWMRVAAKYGGGSIDPSPIPSSGEIQAAPIEPESGYYYHDAASNQWRPTTKADAEDREQAGGQVMKPKGE